MDRSEATEMDFRMDAAGEDFRSEVQAFLDEKLRTLGKRTRRSEDRA